MNDERPPTISVVIPAHNLEAYIARAVRSVLAQTESVEEIIVVDDGSTDGTAAVVEAIIAELGTALVRLTRQEHAGAGAARNAGIHAATSEWIAFLDGDDEWTTEKIAVVRRAICEHADATMVVHDCVSVALDGSERERPLHRAFDPEGRLLPQLYRSNFLATSAVTVRREKILAVGGFDVSLPAAQDYDVWLKLATDAHLLFVPEPLERYITRPGSITGQVFERVACLERIAHRHAPALVRFVGPRRARRMRLRTVAMMLLYYIARESRSRGRRRLALGVLLRAPRLLARALFAPLS